MKFGLLIGGKCDRIRTNNYEQIVNMPFFRLNTIVFKIFYELPFEITYGLLKYSKRFCKEIDLQSLFVFLQLCSDFALYTIYKKDREEEINGYGEIESGISDSLCKTTF